MVAAFGSDALELYCRYDYLSLNCIKRLIKVEFIEPDSDNKESEDDEKDKVNKESENNEEYGDDKEFEYNKESEYDEELEYNEKSEDNSDSD